MLRCPAEDTAFSHGLSVTGSGHYLLHRPLRFLRVSVLWEGRPQLGHLRINAASCLQIPSRLRLQEMMAWQADTPASSRTQHSPTPPACMLQPTCTWRTRSTVCRKGWHCAASTALFWNTTVPEVRSISDDLWPSEDTWNFEMPPCSKKTTMFLN